MSRTTKRILHVTYGLRLIRSMLLRTKEPTEIQSSLDKPILFFVRTYTRSATAVVAQQDSTTATLTTAAGFGDIVRVVQLTSLIRLV